MKHIFAEAYSKVAELQLELDPNNEGIKRNI